MEELEIEVFNFSEALDYLKLHVKVARKGWNGKGMWIYLVVGSPNFSASPTGRPTFLPFIMMKTADNNLVPWLASQTDLLADDWTLVGENNAI